MVELLYHIVYSVRYVSSFMVRRSVVLVRFVVCIPFGICTFLFRRSVVTSTLIASIGSDLYSPVLSLSLFCCFPLLLSLSLSGCVVSSFLFFLVPSTFNLVSSTSIHIPSPFYRKITRANNTCKKKF